MWMVVRMDMHGTNYVMREGLSRSEAEDYLARLMAAQRKVHGQDYSLYGYTAESRASRLAALAIAP